MQVNRIELSDDVTVEVTNEGESCSLKVIGGNTDAQTEAAVLIIRMLKNINSNLTITYELQPAVKENGLKTLLGKVRSKPTFQFQRAIYQASIMPVHSSGCESVHILNVYSVDAAKPSKQVMNDLLANLTKRYGFETIYPIYSRQNDNTVDMYYAISNNAKDFLQSATVKPKFIPAGRWSSVNEGEDFVVFQYISSDNNALVTHWDANIAKVLIDGEFNIDNIVFIHPRLPYVVCKLN